MSAILGNPPAGTHASLGTSESRCHSVPRANVPQWAIAEPSCRNSAFQVVGSSTVRRQQAARCSAGSNGATAAVSSSRPRPEYIPGRIDDPSYVRIFDTTLRDGEQSPGATLTQKEKLDIARQLSKLGVDIIEAGFPVASPGDFAAVRQIAEDVGNQVESDGYVPVICGLSRTKLKDLEVRARPRGAPSPALACPRHASPVLCLSTHPPTRAALPCPALRPAEALP